tara:strand:+ start:307 stop:675 length:369 start_codon:yes stop_codon:yes gene_type:complete
MNKTPTGGTMKFKKKEAGHYICEIGVFEDLYGETSARYEIHVCKYFPGEMTWTGQNYYWSWEIFHFGTSVLTPDGFYHPTFADCKRFALMAFEDWNEKRETKSRADLKKMVENMGFSTERWA